MKYKKNREITITKRHDYFFTYIFYSYTKCFSGKYLILQCFSLPFFKFCLKNLGPLKYLLQKAFD